jgi:hypothetical protein
MRWSGWPRVKIRVPGPLYRKGERDGIPDGAASPVREVEAIAPLIISASRSTDIPAFYGDWFMERLRKGYAKWVNPWNGAPLYVSFENARLFVFWSKNPEPFLPHLAGIGRLGYQSTALFTLNNYEAEGLEPHVPPLEERIATFISMSRILGRGRVVWRWDPLLLSENLDVDGLLGRIEKVGDAIAPYTKRMIISFIDIARYPKVARNLRNHGFGGVREFSPVEEEELAAGLHELNRSWNLRISACGEERDLTGFGIERGQCISYDLMVREFGEDPVLYRFLDQPGLAGLIRSGSPIPAPDHLMDPGQRPSCGCVVSKDIGQYGTCPHLCAYCYANPSPETVRRRYEAFVEKAGHGIFADSILGEVAAPGNRREKE